MNVQEETKRADEPLAFHTRLTIPHMVPLDLEAWSAILSSKSASVQIVIAEMRHFYVEGQNAEEYMLLLHQNTS